MATKKSTTLAKQQQQHFKWYYAIILIDIVAIVGILVLRFSHAATVMNTYYAASGGISPVANTPSQITYDPAVSSNVILSNIGGKSSAFYSYQSPVTYHPGAGNKIQSCVYYSVDYVPEKDRLGTTIKTGPSSTMVSDSSGGTVFSNGPGGYRIACSNFGMDAMKQFGAFPSNAVKGQSYTVHFDIGAGFNSSANNVPLRIWKAEIVNFSATK